MSVQQARIYAYTLESAFLGNILWNELSDIYLMLLSDSYIPNQDSDEYYEGIYGINTHEISVAQGYEAGGKIVTGLYLSYIEGPTPGGTLQLRCDDVTWTGLIASNVKYAVLYYNKPGGVGIEKPLIGYIQLNNSLVPNNEDFTIKFSTLGAMNLSLSTTKPPLPPILEQSARAYGYMLYNLFNQLIVWTASPNVYLMLLTSSYRPNQDKNKVYDDISAYEISNGDGYITGGKVVTNPLTTYTPNTIPIETPGGVLKLKCDDVTWIGLTKTNIRHAVLYYNVGTKPLIGYIQFINTVAPSAEDFTIHWGINGALNFYLSSI